MRWYPGVLTLAMLDEMACCLRADSSIVRRRLCKPGLIKRPSNDMPTLVHGVCHRAIQSVTTLTSDGYFFCFVRHRGIFIPLRLISRKIIPCAVPGISNSKLENGEVDIC